MKSSFFDGKGGPARFVSVPVDDLLDQGLTPIPLDADFATRHLKPCAKTDSPKYWRSKKKLIAWWLVQFAAGVEGTGIQVLPAGRKAQKGSVVLLTPHKVGSARTEPRSSRRDVDGVRRADSRGET